MKQVLWIYAALIGLSLAFGILSALSFLFGARPGLIAQKLRLGSMIIALNTLLAGCYASSKPAEDAGPKPLRLADTGQRSDTDTRSRTDTATSNDTPTESPTDMPGCYDTDVPLPTDDPPDTPTEIECYDCYDGWESDDGTDTPSDTDTATATDTATGIDTATGTDTATATGAPPGISTDDLGCYDTEAAPTDDPWDYPTDIECYDCYDGWESDDGWDAGVETDIPSDTADAGPDSGTDD